jgi:hypothetical protein
MTPTMRPPSKDISSCASAVTAVHLHLPYFDPNLEDVAVAELASEMSAVPWFYLRYWHRGPHLRIRALSPEATALLHRASNHALLKATNVADHGRALDERGYVTAVQETALRGESGTALPIGQLRPPGVYQEVYTPEYERYGGPLSYPSVLTYFAGSTEKALTVLHKSGTEVPQSISLNHRLSAALDEVLRTVIDIRAAFGAHEAQQLVTSAHHFWAVRDHHPPAPPDTVVRHARSVLERLEGTDRVSRSLLRLTNGDVPSLLERLEVMPAAVRRRVVISAVHTHANRLGCGGTPEGLIYAAVAAAI